MTHSSNCSYVDVFYMKYRKNVSQSMLVRLLSWNNSFSGIQRVISIELKVSSNVVPCYNIFKFK